MSDKTWYVPPYNPNVSQQEVMLDHLVSRTARDLTCFEVSFFTEDVTSENVGTFRLAVKEIQYVYLTKGLMERRQLNLRHQEKDSS